MAKPQVDLPHGCLVVDAVTGRTADPATGQIVVRQIKRVEDTLHQAFGQSRAAGELPADSSARPLARFLVVMLQGLHVYDRAVADPAVLRDAVSVALAAVGCAEAAGVPAERGVVSGA